MRRLALLALAGTALLAGNASAATVNGTFQVRAVVPQSCVVVSDAGINFGTYDPIVAHATTDDTATGSIQLRCTKGTVAEVGLDEGDNAVVPGDCVAPARRMLNTTSGEYLAYSISDLASGGTSWGCGTNDRDFTALSNAPFTLTTYGTIPANQTVGVGTFTDVIAYTVTF
jgi:spore coat protein U-like protein